MVNPGDTIVVWFSCGAASAVAAKKTIEKYGDTCTIRIVNNPIAEEDDDNKRFLSDVQDWLNHPIEFAINKKFPSCSTVDVWDKKKVMSNIYGAPCTLELKKNARRQWESENVFHHTVLGFTIDELHRHERFCQTERQILPILIDERLSKKDCFNILHNNGIKLPRIYSLGFPNANCIGCVKSASPTYWNLVRRVYPEVFEKRMEQEKELGSKLVVLKGKRIPLSELPADAVGRKLKTDYVECGIFCEERLNG